MEPLYKYPRTRHIEGSGLQADDDPQAAPFAELAGRYLVVEEKMDGANCGLSFDTGGRMRLQSRGHYLAGGPRERQFELLKSWAARYAADLWALLGHRYILYGEWLYGKHSIFYTDLPHYLLEFDIYDTHEDTFLATEQRRRLLSAAPYITSVRVIQAGQLPSLAALQALIGPSPFIAPDHCEQLAIAAQAQSLDAARVLRETDPSGLMEGLYIKVEGGGAVAGRYKFVRPGFLQTVLESGSHWQERPLLPNQLRAGVSLW
jgi:RNA ligase-like protein